MNAVDVYLLGRKLMKLAEAAFPTDPHSGPLPASVRTVLIDVAQHPGSSISDVTRRTGFPQSHVSASVARLRDQGVLTTSVDERDGRRTVITLTDAFRDRLPTRAPAPIEGALAAELGSPDTEDMRPVTDALKLLSERLTPKALARTGTPVSPDQEKR